MKEDSFIRSHYHFIYSLLNYIRYCLLLLTTKVISFFKFLIYRPSHGGIVFASIFKICLLIIVFMNEAKLNFTSLLIIINFTSSISFWFAILNFYY
jgi:hypothetical protein